MVNSTYCRGHSVSSLSRLVSNRNSHSCAQKIDAEKNATQCNYEVMWVKPDITTGKICHQIPRGHLCSEGLNDFTLSAALHSDESYSALSSTVSLVAVIVQEVLDHKFLGILLYHSQAVCCGCVSPLPNR